MGYLRSIWLGCAFCVTSGTAFAQDWSGFYGGLSVGGNLDGTIDVYDAGGLDERATLDGGSVTGLFGGYLVQRGAGVYGGEVSYSTAEIGTEEFADNRVGDFIDVKARAGYATGRALIYGTVGYAQGTFSQLSTEVDLDGFIYGVGVDYQFNNRFFAGAEYLKRDIEGPIIMSPGSTLKADPATLSLRVGMRF